MSAFRCQETEAHLNLYFIAFYNIYRHVYIFLLIFLCEVFMYSVLRKQLPRRGQECACIVYRELVDLCKTDHLGTMTSPKVQREFNYRNNQLYIAISSNQHEIRLVYIDSN